MTTKANSARKRAPTSSFPPDDASLTEFARWQLRYHNAYGSCGLTPLRPGEKGPYLKNWNNRLFTTPAQVEKHWEKHPNDNAGLCPLPGHFWLDVDDIDALEAMEAKHGSLPHTYTQRTVSGGLHFLFKGNVTTSHVVHFDDKKLGEIRGAGSGQCVAAGSRGIAKDGTPGRWEVEDFSAPAEVPGWLIELIGTRASAGTSKVAREDFGDVTEWDDRRAKELVATILEGQPFDGVAIKSYDGPFLEGERDNFIYQLFALAKDHGIHPHVMLGAVQETGIDGDLGEDVVEAKMRSAYYDGNTQNSVYGCKVPAYSHYLDFQPYVDGKPVPRQPMDFVEWKKKYPQRLPKHVERPSVTPEAETFRALVQFFENVLKASGNRERRAVRFRDTSSVTPVPWIIEGWLSQDAVWLMYGESEAFKTYIAINMLLCIATGRPWGARDGYAGYTVGAPRPVVLFAGESYRGVVQRVHAAIVGGSFSRQSVEENLIIVPDVYSLNSAEGLAQMADEIDAMGVKPAAIAVDTYNLALEGDEDNATDNKRALRGLRAVATRYGAAALAIDHVGHSDKSRPRGSSAKKPNSDGMILCERDSTTNVVTLTQTKNREDDKERYRAAFRATSIALGHDAGGKPISNLAFAAIEPPAASTNKARAEDHAKDFVGRAVADALLDVLKVNPLKDWSDRALAKAIARHDGDLGGEDKIRKLLKPLRGEKTSPVRQCYDGMKARWQFREVDTVDTKVDTEVSTRKRRRSAS